MMQAGLSICCSIKNESGWWKVTTSTPCDAAGPPGGRFAETYYWDSYWIVQGLLVCGMAETARGMVLNALHQVREHGLVPNGARVYYLNRSQPPLLSDMVMALFSHGAVDTMCKVMPIPNP